MIKLVSGVFLIVVVIPTLVVVWRLWCQVIAHQRENLKSSVIGRYLSGGAPFTQWIPHASFDLADLKRGDLVFTTPIPPKHVSGYWWHVRHNRMALTSIITRGMLPIHCAVVIATGDNAKKIKLLEQQHDRHAITPLQEWIDYVLGAREIITVARFNRGVSAEDSRAFLSELMSRFPLKPGGYIPYDWHAVWHGLMTRHRTRDTPALLRRKKSTKRQHRAPMWRGVATRRHTCCSIVYAYLEHVGIVAPFVSAGQLLSAGAKSTSFDRAPKWHPYELIPGDFLCTDFCYANGVEIVEYCILNMD